AVVLAWRARRGLLAPIAAVTLLLAALVAMGLFRTGHSLSPLVAARELEFAVRVLVRNQGPTPWNGVVRAVLILRDWLGWPALLAFGLGLGTAVWRRQLADLILVAFLVPAFLAVAAIPWMDDRFFVYLIPPAAVLLARGLVDAADWARGRPIARIAVVLVTLALLAGDLGRSTWQDILLSLPDTRA